MHANAEIRFKSLAVIPLSIEGEAIGALALSFLSDREFDPEEQAFLGSAAHQAAQTLGRARIYEAQRLAAERLAFLAEASELLAGSLDPTATMARLADLAVAGSPTGARSISPRRTASSAVSPSPTSTRHG